MNTAVLVTVYGRVKALEQSLPSIMIAAREVKAPILVVDDGSEWASSGLIKELCVAFEAECFYIPHNRGLACALNIGLSYWLADKSIDWISYFQDDVQVDPLTLRVLNDLGNPISHPLLTGHDAAEHAAPGGEAVINGVRCKLKTSCRATHMHAHRSYWESVMPIPTRELGCPKKIPGQERGLGSNVDFHIASWAPKSVAKTNRYVACVPGLVRTFLWKAEDSSWSNTQRAGEDQPLDQSSIAGWMKEKGIE